MIRAATYNIHAAIGTDGRQDLERVAAVIEELAADVVGLQEVESRPSRTRLDQAEWLAARLRMGCVEGPMLLEGRGWYGNAVLSRLAVGRVRRLRFADHSGEPRGAVLIEALAADGQAWVIGNTHLDLRAGSRMRQVSELVAAIVKLDPAAPRVLLGDLNEWRPWARTLSGFRQLGELPVAPASYPSRCPLLALDRMVLHGCRTVGRLRRHGSALARRASDHLPIVADLAAVASTSGTKPLPDVGAVSPGQPREDLADRQGHQAAAANREPALGAWFARWLSRGRFEGLAHAEQAPFPCVHARAHRVPSLGRHVAGCGMVGDRASARCCLADVGEA